MTQRCHINVIPNQPPPTSSPLATLAQLMTHCPFTDFGSLYLSVCLSVIVFLRRTAKQSASSAAGRGGDFGVGVASGQRSGFMTLDVSEGDYDRRQSRHLSIISCQKKKDK